MLNERSLTKSEEKRKEEIVKDLKSNKREFVKRYGKDAESVMYGTAVKRAKKQVKEMNENRLKEAVKAALMKKGEVKEERMEFFEPEDYQDLMNLQDATAMMDAIEDLYKKAKALGYGSDVKKLVADLDEELKGGQKKIDVNKDGKISGEDFKLLRAKKGVKEIDDKTRGTVVLSKTSNPMDIKKLTDQGVDVELKEGTWALGNAKDIQRILDMLNKLKDNAYNVVGDDEFYNGLDNAISRAEELMMNAPLEEMDINDPIAMKFRAAKDKLAKMRAANAGDDGNDKFFAKNTARLGKLKALKDKRAEIMRDMEQEAEPEGGPIADRYGDMLNKLDKAIAMLQGQGEWGPEKDVDITAQEIGKRAAMIGLEEDMDLGHEDNEPHMLKGDLYRIGKYAMELYQMVDEFEGKGEVDFPHWWQSKVIKAKEMLVSAKHYLDFEIKEPAIDAMVGVASAEDVIDEEKISAEERLAAAIQKALNKNKSDDDQNNIKQARKAMNDGNMEAAKKILKPYLEEGLPKGYWSKKIPGGKMEESNINENFLAVTTKGAIEDGNLDSFISKMEDAGYKLAKILGPEDNLYKDHPIIDHTWKYGLPKFNNILGPMKDGNRFRYEDQEVYDRMSLEESYEALVKKIKGQGKSEKAAKAIAGAVASYKAKGGGKGPTAKQKK